MQPTKIKSCDFVIQPILRRTTMSDIIKDKNNNYKNVVKAALTEQSSRDHFESNPSPVAKHRVSAVMEKKFSSNKSEKTNNIKSDFGCKKKNIQPNKNEKIKKNNPQQ